MHEAAKVACAACVLHVAEHILKIQMRRRWKLSSHGAVQHELVF